MIPTLDTTPLPNQLEVEERRVEVVIEEEDMLVVIQSLVGLRK